MATAKKGIVARAVDVAVDVFQNPPTAPDGLQPTAKIRRAPNKEASAAKSPVKKPALKMDRKLVAAMEDYEVKYLAQKHKTTQKAVKAAVAKVGNSRAKVEAELKKG